VEPVDTDPSTITSQVLHHLLAIQKPTTEVNTENTGDGCF
jgi:hypothetical protein